MTGIEARLAVVARVLLGLLFVAAGVAKLAGVKSMVDEFAAVGFGQWLRYATGLAEVAGAVLLVRPRTVTAGAALLLAVDAGALYAQATILHQDLFHVVVIGALLAWLGWRYRGAPAVAR